MQRYALSADKLTGNDGSRRQMNALPNAKMGGLEFPKAKALSENSEIRPRTDRSTFKTSQVGKGGLPPLVSRASKLRIEETDSSQVNLGAARRGQAGSPARQPRWGAKANLPNLETARVEGSQRVILEF